MPLTCLAMLLLSHASWRETLVVFGFTAVVLVLWVLVRLVLEGLKVRRTSSWEAATATVERVDVQEQSGFRGDNATRSWRLTVVYRYESGGAHTGQYRFSKDSRADAQALAESLPGTEFRVLVDPADSAKSEVLVRDRPD